jgi:hypothetical protein
MTQSVAPLIVWDANDRSYFRSPLREEAFAWTVEHCGADEDTRRIEFFLMDAPFARVHRYALDAAGRRYLDPATDEIAEQPPVTVILNELPPAHLRYRVS